MKMMKSFYAGAALLVAATTAVPAAAQESPLKRGSVWVASRIDVLPGQNPAYTDYLATQWKKEMEWGKAQGYILSYRILSTNHARNGEPDIILLIEYKDYASAAEREAASKSFNEAMKTDRIKNAAANLDREKIRTSMGSTEYQEWVVK
jgi:hypothetical protein